MKRDPNSSPLNVAISVFGRFHAFYMAQQLHKRGALAQLITTYPHFEVAKYGLPRHLTASCLRHEVLARAWNKIPGLLRSRWNIQNVLHSGFEQSACRALREGANILVGWASYSLRVFEKAKGLGMVTVCERGSSHIKHQTDLLSEEYARAGLRFSETHASVIEREIAEYEVADFIGIPSSFVRRTFIEKGVPDRKLVQIPYGVDLSSFRPFPREDRVFRVVFAGSLSLRKGVQYLLQAFSELKLPQAELWLIGSLTDEIRPILRQFASPVVHAKGHVPQLELARLYSQCSVFCLPSIEDGFGMVIAQAMACGLPTLCSENTGGPDIARENIDGFTVPIRSVETLKERIEWFYTNQEAARDMGHSAHQRVQSGFSWNDYGERLHDSYVTALNHRSPAQGS